MSYLSVVSVIFYFSLRAQPRGCLDSDMLCLTRMVAEKGAREKADRGACAIFVLRDV